VKNTQSFDGESLKLVNKIIDDGVKHTEWNGSDLPTDKVEDAIQKGVKKISYHEKGSWNEYMSDTSRVKDTIQNGVKEVEYYDGDAEGLVNDAIENGVKKVDHQILESMEQKDHLVTTLEFTKKIRDTIENGVKEISSVDCEYPRATENVIKNGVKYMMSGSEFKNIQVDDIIKYSEKL